MKNNRLRQVLIIGSVIFVILVIILSIIGILANRNPYGESIDIKNYGQKVKNLSRDYEHNIEAQLYRAVRFNSKEKVNGASVNDAYIREGSDKQEVVKEDQQYAGSFIVDIESRKESYEVQYAYSRVQDDSFASGYPILVTCVDPQDVKYKEFACKDGSETDNIIKGANSIINFLPYETVSYEIRAELDGSALTIHANLFIPSSDLAGNEASRREVVAMYKNEVNTWIKDQGFNPADYTIEYNYTDDGVKIVEDHDHHGDEDLAE